jgi:hypothetical protein
MTKKFGILTYHNANNFGAALQAYALQRFLNTNFGDGQAEVIDYQCQGVKRQRTFGYVAKGQGILRGLIHYGVAMSRIRNIESFCRKYIPMSDKIADRRALTAAADNYRYIVSGSDQVWNRKWTGGEDTFLQDFHDHSDSKVSYAASFGVKELPEEWKDSYRKLLSDFAHISVREEAGRSIVTDQLGLSADVHLDPTLLLPREDWDKVAADIKVRRPYVLLYMVPFQESAYKKAKKLADDKGLELYVVCKSLRHFSRNYKGASRVEEIIALFKNAEYVVTNSFHGTAFSVIYQRKFVVELDNKWGYNIRSAQLLTTCKAADLSDRPESVECFEVDWERVDNILKTERERVRKYFADMMD